MIYKFGRNDIFHNSIKAHPDVELIIYDTQVYLNQKTHVSGAFTGNVGHTSVGHVNLYELNVDKPGGRLIHPFVTKDGSLTAFKTISKSQFNTDFIYGDTITGSYPLSASISVDRYLQGQTRERLIALKNTLNFYKTRSPHYAFNSSLGDKSTQELKLISIPSIFYGSKIKAGSISLNFYVTGTLAAQLIDDKRNGELRQSLPADANSGSVQGIVLYDEGFMILTGTTAIHPTHTEQYDLFTPATPSSPRWIDFGLTGSTSAPTDGTNVASSSFGIDMKGTQRIPVMTMLCHAPKGELNYSNNPTFLTFNQTGSLTPLSGSKKFLENTNISIKNVVKSNFIEPTASFAKETYISKIGILDKDRNLIGIAKVATPVKKREKNAFTFKLKLDL